VRSVFSHYAWSGGVSPLPFNLRLGWDASRPHPIANWNKQSPIVSRWEASFQIWELVSSLCDETSSQIEWVQAQPAAPRVVEKEPFSNAPK